MNALEVASESLDLIEASFDRCTQMAALFEAVIVGLEQGSTGSLMSLCGLGKEVITEWANHLDIEAVDLRRKLEALEATQ